MRRISHVKVSELKLDVAHSAEKLSSNKDFTSYLTEKKKYSQLPPIKEPDPLKRYSLMNPLSTS